jgi:hypothetical protein
MDRGLQPSSELRVLRSLCDETASREQRRRIADSLSPTFFVEPEHQVVFESIRALLVLGPLSQERLQVHLTTRGFPDTDVARYFPPAA